MVKKLDYAAAPNVDSALAVVFGANSQGAGISESFVGQTIKDKLIAPTLFSGDAIRVADNESPSLPDNFKLGSHLFDAGNLDLEGLTPAQQITKIKNQYLNLFAAKKFAIGLGGDHFIKFAALSAVSEAVPGTAVIYVDAHPDCVLSDSLAYNTILHHAFQLPGISPLQTSVVGLKQVNEAEAEGLRKWQPCLIRSTDFAALSMADVIEKLKHQLRGCQNVYLSVDLDGLDPSSAPAVEAAYPGRPSLHDLICIIHSFAEDFHFIGMDISEHLPQLDPFKITGLTAARLLKEAYSIL
jgi:agmatinase